MRKFLFSFLEIIEFIIVSLALVFIIRSYIIQPFLVWGSSMSPNFSSGDYILIDELSLRFKSIERGEVVVFKYPKNHSTYFIKRIIGLPSEKIQIKDNQIFIFNKENPNGFVLNEPYLSNFVKTENRGGQNIITLGDDEYFVLGDNRQYSYDSRDWGVVKKNEIVGIARLRLWPINSFSVFAAPNY
ncbi:MAG: signal peptidase I [Patescibacteria group bacterium]|nr:signal peptidase I [Patescibacteria group bacterium]MDW8279787.1 signal peptidase I [bacterium]